MHARTLLLLAPLVLAMLGGCAGNGAGSEEEPGGTIPTVRGRDTLLQGSNPPVAFTKIHTPEEVVEAVNALEGRPNVTIEVIGESLFGRPIQHVTVGSGPFDLWIVGRHHGNEPTGGEAILLALRALTDPDPNVPETAPESFRQFVLLRDVLLERITFHFIPIANPDGAAAYTRGNAAQADLNREYFLFTQPEPIAIREAFWQVKPDGCIDLHNEGVGQTDWDAFGPDGPQIEPEIFALANRDVDFALYEVDAAGGRGGDYNEFYTVVNDVPVLGGDILNPTAYHPGTHDLFCSARGAPGYTPEGAISGDSGNGASGPFLEWSTRLHQVTIAISAFHWAGLYDAAEPIVIKEEGTTTAGIVEHEVALDRPSDVRIQLVWRTQEALNDWDASQLTMTVTHAGGAIETSTMEPRGIAWTNTAMLGRVEPGTFTVGVQGTPNVPYEFRAILLPEPAAPVEVSRDGLNLRVRAAPEVAGPVDVRITDVFDPPLPELAAFYPYPSHLALYEGTVDQRVISLWELSLEPGEELLIEGPANRTAVGPYRWTASSGADLAMGVEPVRNPMDV